MMNPEKRASGCTPNPTIRERLTRNAEDFDGIVSDLLAENENLQIRIENAHRELDRLHRLVNEN